MTGSLSGPSLQSPGPAQSDWLIHFCGRPSTAVNNRLPSVIAQASAPERLNRILWDGTLRGFRPFGADLQMICFSESPEPHLKWLLTDRGWPPWGLFFSRQQVYNVGGGPVWYARRAQYGQLPPVLRSWAVPFDTTSDSRSEWLHEREWRIPSLGLSLSEVHPRAILIGDRRWRPVAQPDLNGPDSDLAWPPLWNDTKRIWWDPSTSSFYEAGGP